MRSFITILPLLASIASAAIVPYTISSDFSTTREATIDPPASTRTPTIAPTTEPATTTVTVGPTKTTSVTLSTFTPTTTAKPPVTECAKGSVPLWRQCGGLGYSGSSTCGCGKCSSMNPYYWTCV